MNIKYKKGWSSHMTMLMKTIERSDKSVLELGAGIFSTPFLHWLCKDRNIRLLTLENNIEFFNSANQFRSRLHSIKLIAKTEDFPINEHWGVVFIDHDMPYQKRGEDALRFKDSADYIVLHDTESEELYGYDKIWKSFKYRYDWKECRPWTSVVSNFKDLSWLDSRNIK